jgi:sugar phosphate isomerase/epimerase
MKKQLSAQLFSVRDYTQKDFFGALAELAEIGFTGVEFAGYGNIKAQSMKDQLDSLGLRAVSAHVGIEKLKDDLDRQIDYLVTLGAGHIVCPWASIDTVEKALEHAKLFNHLGELCHQAGLTFSYHNHAHELIRDQGRYPLDVLFENTDPLWLKQQPDLFWIATAGIDPLEYLTRNLSRCPTVHLKQIENMQTRRNVNAGDGILDFHRIMDISSDIEFIYEQEEYEYPSMECMRRSYQYIMRPPNPVKSVGGAL